MSQLYRGLVLFVLIFVCSSRKDGLFGEGYLRRRVTVSYAYFNRTMKTANAEINHLVELAKGAKVMCNKANNRLQGDYLIVDNSWKNFPENARQKVSKCNLPMLKSIAINYRKFINKICPIDERNGQPLAGHGKMNITIQTTEPVGLGTLTRVTQKARVLQRHVSEPLKMMDDLHRPSELQHVASLLLEQVTSAQDYIEEMGTYVRPFTVKPENVSEFDAEVALEEKKMKIHTDMLKRESEKSLD